MQRQGIHRKRAIETCTSEAVNNHGVGEEEYELGYVAYGVVPLVYCFTGLMGCLGSIKSCGCGCGCGWDLCISMVVLLVYTLE